MGVGQPEDSVFGSHELALDRRGCLSHGPLPCFTKTAMCVPHAPVTSKAWLKGAVCYDRAGKRKV